MKPAPTPIPESALRCPYHGERLDDAAYCRSCVQANRFELLFFAVAFAVVIATVVFAILLGRSWCPS